MAIAGLWGCSKPQLEVNVSSSASHHPPQPAPLPRVAQVGEVIVVGDEPVGGFRAESPSTGTIELNWPAVPNSSTYFVMRSHKPTITLGFYVRDLEALSDVNHYNDNEGEPGTSYYYAITAAVGPDRMLLVATGRAKTLAMDGPLQPNLP